jgi:hypothetical protein
MAHAIAKQIKLKAILGSLALYAVYYVIVLAAREPLAMWSSDPTNIIHWFAISGYFALVICGYFAGLLAKKAGCLNAVAFGVLTQFLLITYTGVVIGDIRAFTEVLSQHLFFWASTGIFLPAVGGGCGTFKEQ